MSIFGTLTTPYRARVRVKDFVEKWLPYYLSEVERQEEETVGSTARPAIYRVTRDPEDNWPEDQLPAILIDGEPDDPEMGSGGVGYWFDFTVSAIASGVDEDDSIRIAEYLATAAQALIMQHRGIDGLAEDTVPTAFKTPGYANDEGRTLARAEFHFRSFIPQIVDPAAGPTSSDPPTDPHTPADDPRRVVGVDVSVTGLPVNG